MESTATAPAPAAADPKLKTAPGLAPTEPTKPTELKPSTSEKPGEPVPPAAPEGTPPAEGAPPAAEETPEAPPAPEAVLFDLEMPDGEKREVTAAIAAKAIALTDQALLVIDENKKLISERQSFAKNIVEQPLQTVLSHLTSAYGGNSFAAVKHLMLNHILPAAQEWEAHMAKPEAERLQLEHEYEKRFYQSQIDAQKKREAESAAAAQRADHLSKLNKKLNTVIAETKLPDTDEARALLLEHMGQQRAAGLVPSIRAAVNDVRGIFEKREEALLRSADIERLQKVRPDLAEALEKKKLAEVEKAREEEVKTPPSAPKPRQAEVSHRKPISRWNLPG